MLIFACMFFQLSEGCLMLNDTTGVVTIIGMNKLPQGCPPLNKGRILHNFSELWVRPLNAISIKLCNNRIENVVL